MRVYVAGKLKAKEEIQVAQEQVRTAGHEISYDWTRYKGTSPNEAADLDLNGVLTADAVIILFTDPKHPYRGSFTELGAALASKKRIFAICPDEQAECRTNCFFHATGVEHVANVADALERLAQ